MKYVYLFKFREDRLSIASTRENFTDNNDIQRLLLAKRPENVKELRTNNRSDIAILFNENGIYETKYIPKYSIFDIAIPIPGCRVLVVGIDDNNDYIGLSKEQLRWVVTNINPTGDAYVSGLVETDRKKVGA